MKAATAPGPRPDLEEVKVADVETKFHVEVAPTDEEGVHYVEIDAKRVFTTTRELHNWLNSCVWKLTTDLVKSGKE